MISRLVIFGVVIGIVGLVFGYFIFGKVAGEYISIKQVFQSANNVLEDITGTITGLKTARRNIWISGAVGAGVGLILGGLIGRKRT